MKKMRSSRLLRKLANRTGDLQNYFRAEWRLARNSAWQQQPALYQPWPFTKPNRHPEFFEIAKRHFSGKADIRLLSFGCATGDEVFALAEYLPQARIDGIDINQACIAKAKRRTPAAVRHRISFSPADMVPDIAERYDAIFCLSVLRHAKLDAQRPTDCSSILSFDRFESAIAAFDHALKPGGLLIIWGANFRFADTKFAARYRAIPVPDKRGEGGACYGRDNQLLDFENREDWVFEKQASAPKSL